jgi:hypothetical protein
MAARSKGGRVIPGKSGGSKRAPTNPGGAWPKGYSPKKSGRSNSKAKR